MSRKIEAINGRVEVVGRALFVEPEGDSMIMRAMPENWRDLILTVKPKADADEAVRLLREAMQTLRGFGRRAPCESIEAFLKGKG